MRQNYFVQASKETAAKWATKGTILTMSLAIFLGWSAPSFAAAAKAYPNHRGGTINFPLGNISFADEVVSYTVGDPAPSEELRKPEVALGAPDYIDENHESEKQADCPLGGGGKLVLRFTDNALIDVPGPDLYVFEVGPAIEATNVEISADGTKWINIGRVEGSTATIDIAKFVKPGDVFHCVRLTDLRQSSGGSWSGADIDAVGAIGSAMRISLDTAVLFDFNKAILKPEAKDELARAMAKIKQAGRARLQFEGHTDNLGTDAYNNQLSMTRATAVRDYLKKNDGLSLASEVKAFGETRPVASNDNEEGRARNRRVDILVIPTP